MSQSVEEIRKEIGERVRNLRVKRGWTDEVLGQMIDLSGSSLNNKERGVRDFTWDEMIRLSDVFRVSIDELVRGVKPENLAAHRKTGLTNAAVETLKDFYEYQSIEKMKGVNRALSSRFVLDALGRYMSFRPKEQGYYLSETATREHSRFIECRMSQQLFFNVLGQNLLQVLNEARRLDHEKRRHYEVLEDFIDPVDEDEDEDEPKLAEPSEYERMDNDGEEK